MPPAGNIVGRLSIGTGNAVQLAGLAAGCVALHLAGSSSSKRVAIAAMICGWVLFYFFCHGIAHWAAGRIFGIRFAFYTVGGTDHPEGYPAGVRWVFEHLPFFGVRTEKASMQKASPAAKAIMWSAGVTASALVPTLSALYAWKRGVPGSMPFSIFAIGWAIGTLSSNWRNATGDYAKARRVLSPR